MRTRAPMNSRVLKVAQRTGREGRPWPEPRLDPGTATFVRRTPPCHSDNPRGRLMRRTGRCSTSIRLLSGFSAGLVFTVRSLTRSV